MNLFARLAAVACSASALLFTAAAAGPELGPESFGILKDKPTYIQEWHIWWGFPYPDSRRPFSHMDSTLTASGEPWRLDWNRNGYPLVGLYDSANPDIIRWQIRCMKAAGLDSVAVMIHPDNGKGIEFIQEAPEDMIRTILDIAAEEKFPVFFMDEVAFRKGSVSQNPEIMAQRIIRFLKKYASSPGFYRVDGKPVYYFQTYGWSVKPEELEAMFRKVETAAGPVHWMIFGAVNRFGKIPQLAWMVDGASHHRRSKETRAWQLNEQAPAHIFSAGHKLGKKITDMQYPKFDGTSQPWRQTGVAQYGLGGRTLETTILNSLRSNPDFIMLSSWNDWEEGANFEPGWDFDGFSGDPYLYCRVIAHLRGREFVPPPLPPKEAVHPTIREKLGYGDGAGPLVEKIERSHNRGGALAVTVRDTASEVAALEAVWNGDLYYLAPQSAGGRPQGALVPRSELPKSELQQNLFGYTPGRAVPLPGGEIAFTVPEPEKLPETFAVGTATVFDPENPMQKVTVRMANRTPVLLREPTGGKQADCTLSFTPYPRDSQFPAALWNGWRTGGCRQSAPGRPRVEAAHAQRRRREARAHLDSRRTARRTHRHRRSPVRRRGENQDFLSDAPGRDSRHARRALRLAPRPRRSRKLGESGPLRRAELRILRPGRRECRAGARTRSSGRAARRQLLPPRALETALRRKAGGQAVCPQGDFEPL